MTWSFSGGLTFRLRRLCIETPKTCRGFGVARRVLLRTRGDPFRPTQAGAASPSVRRPSRPR